LFSLDRAPPPNPPEGGWGGEGRERTRKDEEIQLSELRTVFAAKSVLNSDDGSLAKRSSGSLEDLFAMFLLECSCVLLTGMPGGLPIIL
jgi:hypothetical protein